MYSSYTPGSQFFNKRKLGTIAYVELNWNNCTAGLNLKRIFSAGAMPRGKRPFPTLTLSSSANKMHYEEIHCNDERRREQCREVKLWESGMLSVIWKFLWGIKRSSKLLRRGATFMLSNSSINKMQTTRVRSDFILRYLRGDNDWGSNQWYI